MYEDKIDWIFIAEKIGVISAGFLKIFVIWVPVLIVFALYILFTQMRREKYAKRLRRYAKRLRKHLYDRKNVRRSGQAYSKYRA